MTANSTPKPSLKDVSKTELMVGAKMAYANAEDLLNDGGLLFRNKKYPRAHTLFQLAIEEVGKAFMLLDLRTRLEAQESNKQIAEQLFGEIDYKSLDKIFYSHQKKSKTILETQLVSFEGLFKYFPQMQKYYDATLAEPFIKSLQEDIANILNSDNLKNQSLYISLNSNKFISPSEVITEQMASILCAKVVGHVRFLGLMFQNPNAYVNTFLTQLIDKQAKSKAGNNEN